MRKEDQLGEIGGDESLLKYTAIGLKCLGANINPNYQTLQNLILTIIFC